MSHWHCQLLYLVAKRLYVYAIGGTQSGTICKKLFTTHSLQSTHIISWHSADKYYNLPFEIYKQMLEIKFYLLLVYTQYTYWGSHSTST